MPGILLLIIFSPLKESFAQNFEETIEFADLQYNQANYQLAVKEYQRALFFAKSDSIDYLYKQIASAFLKNNQFDQANYFYDLSYRTTKNDSLKNELIFYKAQCYLFSGDFQHSIYELTNLGNTLTPYFRQKQCFYFAISYFGLEDFKKSETYFLCLKENDSIAKQEITRLFKSRRNLYRPNPNTARTLSRIIPGSGQLYSGDLKNGLNSIVLTGGLALLGVYIYNEYSLFDSILSTFPWFLRYYKGGYQNAKKIAQKKRAIRRNKTYKQILEIIKDKNE
jgi:hypothetical protein